jgi:phosphopantothenoylcysteine decarboxylase
MSDTPALKDTEILLGITGGIAAYKSADLASKLVQSGAKLTVAMTESAKQFVGPTTFEALTGRPVYDQLFAPVEHFQGEHIGLARRATLFVVAPATANFIGRFANGIADDLVSTLAMTVTCPVIIAPAMNTEMWNKPAVQRNINQLREDGVLVIEPGSGWLSCGQVGAGRMSEPSEILKTICRQLS